MRFILSLNRLIRWTHSCDMWKHWNCSSAYYLKKYFKALKTDISVLVILQSADKSLTGSQTTRSLHLTAESVDSSLLVLNALSCSVVTSHSALRNEGKLQRDPSNALSAAHAGYCHGGPGQTRVFRWAPNVLVSNWMIVGSGIYRGVNEYKVKCIAVNWPTVRNKSVDVSTASHHQREIKCLGALVSRVSFRMVIVPVSGGGALWRWELKILSAGCWIINWFCSLQKKIK